MKKPFLLFLILSSLVSIGFPCSMFKLSDASSTVVGCNHDAWVTEPQLWFTSQGYGAAFTGGTRYGDRVAPQSGMNEHGLVFTTLTIYPPQEQDQFRGEPVSNRGQFLESVLQRCSSLEEVESFWSNYDRSIFLQDLFVYVDTLGRVLFVEPFKIHYRSDPTLVQSNFCPSETPDTEEIQQARFIDGQAYISNGYDVNFDFARSMMEEMSVCRERHGDGTLISTLWNNRDLSFEVVFYHDFDSVRSYSLRDELAKGDATYPMTTLFPANAEFEELKTYRTPFNTPALRMAIAAIGSMGGLLAILFLLISFGRGPRSLARIQAILALSMFGFCYVLATDIGIYYFDWPYTHPTSLGRTLLSYTPLLFVLLGYWTLRSLGAYSGWRRALFMTSAALQILLIASSIYWLL